MTDFATAAYHLAIGCWWLLPIVLGGWVAALGLARAAAKPMPPMTDAEADGIWAEYLAALNLTPDDVRAVRRAEQED